jgi:hypothetical protein
MDCESRDVPTLWEAGERDIVIRHLRYDLLDLRKVVENG